MCWCASGKIDGVINIKPSIGLSSAAGNLFVKEAGGKWLYWGLIHIIEVKHDYINKTTSGKFKIIYINKPEEMEMAHNLIDRNKDTFFKL